jgi:Protein of unknown function (DUF3866)
VARQGVLKLRSGTVREAQPPDGPQQRLTVELTSGQRRAAVVDVALIGACQVGDEVVVNVQALDLGLGSGGFDVVHVNLTRGLDGEGVEGAHVMKLNYSSLQHAVHVVEEGVAGRVGERGDSERSEPPTRPSAPGEPDATQAQPRLPAGSPVAVLALHGQLAPLAWAFAQSAPGTRLGFVQTAGGALSGGHSRVVRALRERGLLAGHVTAGSAYGGEHEAVTTAGALLHGFQTLGWQAAVCGPGPGIVGSGSLLGHGGMYALDSAHTALALGAAPVVLAVRMSSADPRPRHQGLSHHTETVLRLLLQPVLIALPADPDEALGLEGFERGEPHDTSLGRHRWRSLSVDLAGYGRSGLPSSTMGRSLSEDPLFFAAALAAGAALAGADDALAA